MKILAKGQARDIPFGELWRAHPPLTREPANLESPPAVGTVRSKLLAISFETLLFVADYVESAARCQDLAR